MRRLFYLRLGLALLTPVVLIGGLEAIVRVTSTAPPPPEMRFPGFELVPQDLAAGLCPMQRHPTRFYGQVPNQRGPFASDEHAFRGGSHPEWHEDLLRVAFVGDSCTMGFGCRYSESFVGVAEAKLRERFPDREVDAINAGCAGYSTFQNRLDLEERVLPMRPTAIVLAISAWNDTQGAVEFDDAAWGERLSARESGIAGVVRQLHLSRVVENFIATSGSGADAAAPPPERPRGQRPNGARVSESQFRSNVTQMIERSRSVASDVLVVLLTTTEASERSDPEPKRYREIARGIAAERGVSVLDVEPLFPLRDSTTFFDSIHPAEAGHRAVGEAIAARIAERLANSERRTPAARLPLPQLVALEPTQGFAFGEIDLLASGSGFSEAKPLRFFLGGEPLSLVAIESDTRVRLAAGPLPSGRLALEVVSRAGTRRLESAFEARAPTLQVSLENGIATCRVSSQPADRVTLLLATARGETLKLFGRRFELGIGTLLPQKFEGAIDDSGAWSIAAPLRSASDGSQQTIYLQAIVDPARSQAPRLALYTNTIELRL